MHVNDLWSQGKTIDRMDFGARKLLRRYGDHTQTCTKRAWLDNWHRYTDHSAQPDCDCGWLEALGATCEGANGKTVG